jgi:hypothetical protein
MQRGKQGVVYAAPTEELKRRELGQPVQLIVHKSSAWEAVKTEPERVKRKNFHC